MTVPAPVLPLPEGVRRASVSLSRALGSSTRAGIFEHLQQTGAALSVREVAAVFELHPNVARTHLETLADAGLVAVGRRKHPGGGRPAKVYRARDDASAAVEAERLGQGGPSQAERVLVRLLSALLEPTASSRPVLQRAQDAAAASGRRLVSELGARPDAPGLDAAATVAVRALRTVAPHARVLRSAQEWVDLAGVRGIFAALEETRPDLAEAFERGLVTGALAATGVVAALADAGTTPAGELTWRVRAAAVTSSRNLVTPAATVDARGQHREKGVVQAMRAVTGLASGDVLEVLAEGPGAPAAFARWADRAGHELLGVERSVDTSGRPAIRLLIRKGAG